MKPEIILQECRKIHDQIERISGSVLNKLENIVPRTVVNCTKWEDFKQASADASLVAFETDLWNEFVITSVCHEYIFRYSERLPLSMNDPTPKDLICHKILDLNEPSLKLWLSEELEIPQEMILAGSLEKPVFNVSIK